MNSITMLFIFAILALLFLCGAYVMTIMYNVFPPGQGKSLLQEAYNITFGLFDQVVFLIFILYIAAGVVVTYANPKPLLGIMDIGALFLFAFFYLQARGMALNIGNIMSANTLMPNTYALVSSNWVALFIFVMLALEAVMNFRAIHPHHAQQSNGENHQEGEN